MADRAWSHSALSSYETCPKKHWHLSVAKDIVEPPSEQQTYGNFVHSAFDQRVKRGTPLPLGLRQHEAMLSHLAKASGEIVTEQKLAITADLQPCEWFARNVWVRAVIDYAALAAPRAMIIDWKTGKKKDGDDQLALMAAVLMCHMSEIEHVSAAFFWMQEPVGYQLASETYTREGLAAIFNRFYPRVERYQRAFQMTEFPATPGRLCRRWCPVKSCPYHGA